MRERLPGLFIRLAAAVCLFLASVSLAETPDATLEVLREIESKKIRIQQQMGRMPRVVDEQSKEVMARMDKLWASEATTRRFAAFLDAIEAKMEEVRIPERHSNRDVVFAMYGSLHSTEAIDRIIREYTDLLTASIDGLQEAFIGDITTQMADELQEAFDEAQSEIASLFDQTLASQFPHWPQAFQTANFDELFVGRAEVETGPHPLQMAMVVTLIVAAIAKAISRKITARVGAKVAGKVAGKVFLKLIPLVGWVVVLAWTARDYQNARNDLESDVRKEVLSIYREEIVPAKLWKNPGADGSPSSREMTETLVREKLELWTKECIRLVETFLDTALLLENPAFARFIEERAEKGMSIKEIAALSQEIHASFGPLVHRAPSVEIMLDMMVTVSSREDLIRFRQQMGPVLFDLYAEHGRELLHALSSLGPYPLADMIRQDRDWRAFHRLSERWLPSGASSLARQGLWICIELEFPMETVASTPFFETTASYRELFTFLVEQGTPPAQIAALLQRQSVPEFLTQILKRDPQLVAALLREFEPGQLTRLGVDGRLPALFLAHQVSQTPAPPFPTRDFVRLLGRNNDLLNIAEEFGRDGLKIFFSYVGPDSGTAQHQRALQAIDLYRRGAPLEFCLDAELLSTTLLYYGIPAVGPAIYAFMYPVHRALPMLARILILCLALLPILLIYKLLRPRKKKRRIRPARSRKNRRVGSDEREPPWIEVPPETNADASHERKKLPKP